MRTKNDKEKQLYTQLYAAQDRLSTMRILYNETHNMRYLRGIQTEKNRLEEAKNLIEIHRLFK